MRTESQFQQALSDLHELARWYGDLEQDHQAFLDHLHQMDESDLRHYLERNETLLTKAPDGVRQISPVVFVRRIIVQRILDGRTVTLSDIEEIQRHIDRRDTGYFVNYPHLHEEISNQKERTRSAFNSWDAFKILFGIDYHFRGTKVKRQLEIIAEFLQDELDLTKCDYHLAGFNHNQNFGTHWCWVALYPAASGDHKDAHQVFLSVKPDRYTYGLVSGSRVEHDHRDELDLPADQQIDVSDLLESYREKLPQFYSLNQKLEASQNRSPKQRQRVREKHPLNLILYGPPGTGKTYSVRQHAVEIVEGTSEDLSESEISERFGRYIEEGRVEFTTFHPSYSYEEFIEGFRYDPVEKIPVLHDGILKRIADRALNPHRKVRSKDSARIWKVSLGDLNNRDIYDRCIQNNEIAIGWWGDTDFTGMDKEAVAGVFTEHGKGDKTNSINCVDYFVSGIGEGDYVAVLNDQKTIRGIGVVTGPYKYRSTYDRYPHVRPVEWLDQRTHDIYEMNGGKNIGQPTLYPLDRISFRDFVELLPEQQEEARPYVLVIDEVNRGNLARIFGELITLLEPDKRKGAKNEFTVRLPYSKQRFSLPSNLYVIGTMNTADRSIALLDVALRRRFEFQEMMPNVEIIKDQLMAVLDEDEEADLTTEQIELIRSVFTTLNGGIMVLLDRDHQIGHSYFLNVRSMADLHHVWYRRVLPLLQEYFYNDPQRLGHLLGTYQRTEKTGFVKSLKRDLGQLFDGKTGVTDSMPWTFHRYQVGELEEVLRQTFYVD